MYLETYDVILKKNSKNIISRFIQSVTKDVYSHSQIYLGNWHIIDAMPNGVKVRNFDNSLNEFDAYRYYRKITDKEKESIEHFLQKSINTKYGFIELICQLFKIQYKQKKKHICISLIIDAFKSANMEVDDWQIGFKQISNSKYFKKVNGGNNDLGNN